jgi:hypothetical protein
MDKQGTLEDTQLAYTKNIRFGLYEQALPLVAPEHQARFQAELPRFRELRFSNVHTESIEFNAMRSEAQAVVVYRGYSLSQPFEREIRIVQQWSRQPPSQKWYVTPDFDGLLSPRDVSREPSPAPASLIER